MKTLLDVTASIVVAATVLGVITLAGLVIIKATEAVIADPTLLEFPGILFGAIGGVFLVAWASARVKDLV